MSDAKLCLYFERLDRLEEEKKNKDDDIKECYAEAKAEGYDIVIMRKIQALRRMERDARLEMEALIETYKAAVGLA